MKRNITAIAEKAQRMTLRAYHNGMTSRYYAMIINAQVKEIRRLMDPVIEKRYSGGFDAGFTCAEIACNCNITEAQNQYDQPPAPSSDLANIHAGVPGPSYNPIVSELQQIICGSLKPKP